MATQVGTYSIADLIAVRYQSVNAFGANTVAQVLQQDLANHNAIVNDMMSGLALLTTDTQAVYGSGASGQMIEVDEFGRTETQKISTGSTVAFPLRLFQYSVGWTRKYLENATPADLAQTQLSAQIAHKRAIERDIKRAIFYSTNITFTDFLINNVSLGVKRFVNADSANIPDAPDGSTFDSSTHTHYDANATLTDAFVAAELNDLYEHGHGARPMIATHYSDVADWIALTNFVPALESNLERGALDEVQAIGRTNSGAMYNRLIGFYGAAEVWVKPWAVANYGFAWDGGSPNKPLAFRQRNTTSAMQGLRLAAELDAFPLHSQFYEAEFGIGVWTRTNGVVFRFDNGTYADPTIS